MYKKNLYFQKLHSEKNHFCFFTAGVMAQEVEVVSTAQPAEAYIRGDMIPQTPQVPGKKSTLTHQIKEKREIFDFCEGKLTILC